MCCKSCWLALEDEAIGEIKNELAGFGDLGTNE
jgi:hypothetical protein